MRVLRANIVGHAPSVRFLNADRTTVKTIMLGASHSECTGARTVGWVLNVCFNDCANILGCAPSPV